MLIKIKIIFDSKNFGIYFITGLTCISLCGSPVALAKRDAGVMRMHGYPVSTNDIIIWPEAFSTIPEDYADVVKLVLPAYISGRIKINREIVEKENLKVTLIQKRVAGDDEPDPGVPEPETPDPEVPEVTEPEDPEDETMNPEGSAQEGTFSKENEDKESADKENGEEDSEDEVNDEEETEIIRTIELKPMIVDNGRGCAFYIDQCLSPGEWSLNIPEGYFELEPKRIELGMMPLSVEDLSQLEYYGYWHKDAESIWDMQPMFSVHDDDAVDGTIPSSKPSANQKWGYFSILYPLLESMGVKGCVSMEGRRSGMTSSPPMINSNAEALLRLEQERGWEVQSHSMTCLGEVLNNWVVDSLQSELAQKILETGTYKGLSSSTETVYDLHTGLQYFPDESRTGWIESPKHLIKPYAGDYYTRKSVLYNKEHDVDYQWGEWFRIAKEWGFKANSWVQYNSISSHNYAAAVNAICPNGFNDMVEPYQYNKPPLRSTATRMLVEGQSAPGYMGGDSDNNLWDDVQYEWFKKYIDRCVEERGWIVLGLHAYRDCWKNSLPGALVSEGGNYPDEWVEPMKDVDYLNDPLTPPARLGITDWSEWYPCPGTRLDMFRSLLNYCLEKGMLNVTSSEGFEIIGNKEMVGYFNNGVRIGNDRQILIDDRENYPHYIKSAAGEEDYYCPLFTDQIAYNFNVEAPEPENPEDPDVTTGIKAPIYRGEVKYYNLNGVQVHPKNLTPGVYIKCDANGIKKIII